jgi:chaperonin GroEL
MAKIIQFGDEARENMLAGMETVANAVSITMWPKGRNVILEKQYGVPLITNDGVTIAREIELEDKFQNMWAQLIIDAADRTNTHAGDGTTTATVLTYAFAKEGLSQLKSGVNAVELKNGMIMAASEVIKKLEENAKAISSESEIAQVATISAQDPMVGDIIAVAMETVGNNWVISVSEGQTFGLSVEITEGMQFENGFISPYMVTNPEKMLAEIDNAPVLIVDHKISNVADLLPILEKLMQSGKKDLLIMAEDIEWDALTAIILNNMKGILNIIAVKNPGFGDNKKGILKDIAILTWAKIITADLGMKLSEIDLEVLWSVDNVSCSQEKTTLIGWKWDKSDIEARVLELKSTFESTDSTFAQEQISARIAKLDGWVAMIKVGAASEVESKDKKLRIEDALNATRAAVEEGVVAWGWVALLQASKVLEWMDFGMHERNLGAKIVQQALSYPIIQIADNAGKNGQEIANIILAQSDVNYWYDAAMDEYGDMIKKWIIDPTKVERVALEESVSLAGMFLTTGASITSIPKPETPATPMNPAMWGWMMPGMM